MKLLKNVVISMSSESLFDLSIYHSVNKNLSKVSKNSSKLEISCSMRHFTYRPHFMKIPVRDFFDRIPKLGQSF